VRTFSSSKTFLTDVDARFTKEMANPSAGLLAAAFIGIAPGYISRSVAGSYDNEAIAIFLLMITFYLWIKALRDGSALWGMTTALFYGWMVSAWGGYVFITNSKSSLIAHSADRFSNPASRLRPHPHGPVQQPSLHLIFSLVCHRHPRIDASPVRRLPPASHVRAYGRSGRLRAPATRRFR